MNDRDRGTVWEERYFLSKEPYILSKEPYIPSEEPYIPFKKPYMNDCDCGNVRKERYLPLFPPEMLYSIYIYIYVYIFMYTYIYM